MVAHHPLLDAARLRVVHHPHGAALHTQSVQTETAVVAPGSKRSERGIALVALSFHRPKGLVSLDKVLVCGVCHRDFSSSEGSRNRD